MEFVRMILENIFSENSPKYINIFKANDINDESIKLLTVEDFDALIPDDEEARDKIIGSFADLLTTDSFTWPREPKPGQMSQFKKSSSSSAVQPSQHNGNGHSSSESDIEVLPKRTKNDVGAGSSSNGGGASGNGDNGIQNDKVPQEILQKRTVDNKTKYLVKWAGKKKLLTWEWSYDKKLENYQYMIREFEEEQEKEVVNDDCNIVDEERPGPSESRTKSRRNGNHDQGSRENIDEDYNNYDFGDDGDTAYVVEAIRDKRKAGRRWEFEIKWQGYPESDNTWEPRTSLKECQEMLKAFEAVWKANNNNNQNQTDRGNGNETTNSKPRNHRNREENDSTSDDNQPKISKTLEERRENRKVNSFYKSLKLVSAQDESIQQARANSNAVRIPAVRLPKAWPKTSGHRLGGAKATATVPNKNGTTGNQSKKKNYKNIMDLSSSSTSDSDGDGDDNEINRKIHKKKSKVKMGSSEKAKEFSTNTNNANSDSASATQNINGSNSNHHENENENNYSPNSAMINGTVGVVEFPMFEDSSTSDDEFEQEDDESPFVSVIKTENNPDPDDEPVVVPDIYSNLTMDYQNLDDDSN